jgi:uncharacterized protein (DUF111 family)
MRAIDTLIDVVGVLEGFHLLEADAVAVAPVPLGSGPFGERDGPVTATTTRLARGLTIAADAAVEGEATTPTGAALLAALSTGVQTAPSDWRAERHGFGAGSRELSYPNCLRLAIGIARGIRSDPDDAVNEVWSNWVKLALAG